MLYDCNFIFIVEISSMSLSYKLFTENKNPLQHFDNSKKFMFLDNYFVFLFKVISLYGFYKNKILMIPNATHHRFFHHKTITKHFSLTVWIDFGHLSHTFLIY